MAKYNFVQIVSRPTRITDHSCTLLDHVYTNDISNTMSCNVLTLDISDHLATLTTISLGKFSHQVNRNPRNNRDGNNPTESRIFNEANKQNFKQLIDEEVWEEVFLEDHAEAQYNKFSEIYPSHYNSAYPLISKRVRRKNERADSKPWILPWLEEAIARKQTLYHESVTNPSEEKTSAYKNMNAFCEKHVNIAKDKYYQKYFNDHKDCSKKQWQMINTLMNRSSRNNSAIKLKDTNGNMINTSRDVFEEFNDYFSNIASNIKRQISSRTTFDPGGFANFL